MEGKSHWRQQIPPGLRAVLALQALEVWKKDKFRSILADVLCFWRVIKDRY